MARTDNYIFDGRVIIDGEQWIGTATSITLPSQTLTVTAQKFLGLFVQKELITGMEIMELQLTMAEGAAVLYSLIGQSRNITITGTTTSSNGIAGNYSFQCQMTTVGKTIEGSTIGEDIALAPVTLSVRKLEIFIDGDPVVRLDPDNNVLEYSGTDLLANYRTQ